SPELLFFPVRWGSILGRTVDDARRQDAGPAAEGCPMATAPSPNDLTRQQLDELDALLQRMLSLPLNPAEAATAGMPAVAPIAAPPLPDAVVPPAVKNWRVDPAAPSPAPPPPPPAPPAPPPPPPPRSPPPPPGRAPPAPRPAGGGGGPARPNGPPPRPPPPPPPPPLPPPPPPAPSRRAAPTDDGPLLLWPLVAVNRLADALLGLFGPPGRFL